MLQDCREHNLLKSNDLLGNQQSAKWAHPAFLNRRSPVRIGPGAPTFLACRLYNFGHPFSWRIRGNGEQNLRKTWVGLVTTVTAGTTQNFSARPLIFYNYHYYYIAHFSKYIRPNAVRIGSTAAANLEVAAAENADGSIVVVVMNRSDTAATVKLKQGTKIIKPTIPAHAIVDFIY